MILSRLAAGTGLLAGLLVGLLLGFGTRPLAAQTVQYSYDQAGRLSAVEYPNGKTIRYTYDVTGNLLSRTVIQEEEPPPPLAITAVTNAATFAEGPVAPGEIVTVFGSEFGPGSISGVTLDGQGRVSTVSGETRVLFDGVAAPMVYSVTGQVSAIVPYGVAPPSTEVVVEYQGVASEGVTVAVTDAAPALFSFDSSGSGNGAILNQDNTVNSASNPAAKGSYVVLYGTGEGQTDPAGVDGQVAATVFPKPLLPVTVTIGGIAAEVAYAGAAPLLVAGVLQVNARVPAGVASGAVPVVVTVGGKPSQAALTVSVE